MCALQHKHVELWYPRDFNTIYGNGISQTELNMFQYRYVSCFTIHFSLIGRSLLQFDF